MGNAIPTIQDWKNLFDAALKFKKIAPWQWMWDSDIFGVQNPANGEIGYCCIMGAAKEIYALAVYQGSEGLESYLRLNTKYHSESLFDLYTLQKCVMLSFEDRANLTNEDLQIIKSLGLQFRGHNEWPLFRSFRPGFFPWFIAKEEAEFLTVAIHQAIEVALQFEKNPNLLSSIDEDYYLVRVPHIENDAIVWKNELLKTQPYKEFEIKTKPVDEKLLERINKLHILQKDTWEIDYFFYPSAVKEKNERPFYPYIILWVDHRSGYILHHHLANDKQELAKIPELFLHFIEYFNSIPKTIITKHEMTYQLLEPVAKSLNINLIKKEKLKGIEEAQIAFFENFR